MSTDLHLNHELPKLRISTATDDIEDTISSSDETDSVPSTPVAAPRAADSEVDDGDVIVAAGSGDDDSTGEEEEERFRTPTSKESKIPAVLNCPPAPKKPKAFVACKRKLMDAFQFFEVKNKEDMDAFFRSTFPKRPCPCT